jgi:hypothetical protein
MLNLSYLNLYGTAVSDAELEQLTGLKNLRNLYVWQTKVTDEEIKKLKQTLPGVDIDKGLVDKSRRTEAAGLERDGFTDVYFPQNFAARTIVGVAGPTFFPDMRCFPSARLRGITRDR